MHFQFVPIDLSISHLVIRSGWLRRDRRLEAHPNKNKKNASSGAEVTHRGNLQEDREGSQSSVHKKRPHTEA